MVWSPATPSRICSRPPQLSSRAQRIVAISPVPAIPLRIKFFADPPPLNPHRITFLQKSGGVPSPTTTCLPLTHPHRYTQETPQPHSFHALTSRFSVHPRGTPLSAPPQRPCVSARSQSSSFVPRITPMEQIPRPNVSTGAEVNGNA